MVSHLRLGPSGQSPTIVDRTDTTSDLLVTEQSLLNYVGGQLTEAGAPYIVAQPKLFITDPTKTREINDLDAQGNNAVQFIKAKVVSAKEESFDGTDDRRLATNAAIANYVSLYYQPLSSSSGSSSALTIDTEANATSTATRSAQEVGTGIFYQTGTQLRVQYKSGSSNFQDVLLASFDITNPVITITGDNPASVAKGETYTDAGATALDNVDGDVTSSIQTTINVDTSTVGTNNTVTYSVRDTAGNVGTAIRAVHVNPEPFHTVTQSGASDSDFPNLWTTTGNQSGTTLSSLSSTSNGTDLQIKIEIITPTATFTMTYLGIPLNQVFNGRFTEHYNNFALTTFTTQTNNEFSATSYTEQFSTVKNAIWCLASHETQGRSHALNKRGIIIHAGSPPFPIVGNHIISGNTSDGEVNLGSNWTTINIYAS